MHLGAALIMSRHHNQLVSCWASFPYGLPFTPAPDYSDTSFLLHHVRLPWAFNALRCLLIKNLEKDVSGGLIESHGPPSAATGSCLGQLERAEADSNGCYLLLPLSIPREGRIDRMRKGWRQWGTDSRKAGTMYSSSSLVTPSLPVSLNAP